MSNTINQGTGGTFEPSMAGHYCEKSDTPLGYGEINRKCTRKLRYNILINRWPADKPEEVRMLREFKKTKMSPDEFLDQWK